MGFLKYLWKKKNMPYSHIRWGKGESGCSFTDFPSVISREHELFSTFFSFGSSGSSLQCVDVSRCRTHAQQLWHLDLVAVCAPGAQNLTRWTTREVPLQHLFTLQTSERAPCSQRPVHCLSVQSPVFGVWARHWQSLLQCLSQHGFQKHLFCLIS